MRLAPWVWQRILIKELADFNLFVQIFNFSENDILNSKIQCSKLNSIIIDFFSQDFLALIENRVGKLLIFNGFD